MKIYNRNGDLVFEGDNFAQANLFRADLAWADLTDANMVGADLTCADLTKANLTGANLIDADLTGANLYMANLSKANLTGANIAGANIADADLTDVKYQVPITLPIIQIANLGRYKVTLFDEHMRIAHVEKPFDEWESLTEEEVDVHVLDCYKKYKRVLKALIKIRKAEKEVRLWRYR